MSVTPDEGVLIELDDRRRVSLGKLGHHSRYLARELDDGTLVLEPAVVMTQLQATLNGDPELIAKMEANAADPSQRRQPRRSRRKAG
jgi:hypothetical protein